MLRSRLITLLTITHLLLCWAAESHADGVVYRRSLWNDQHLQERLANGTLERGAGDGFADWDGRDTGYGVDAAVSHSGEHSARLNNRAADGRSGMAQILHLDQKTPQPIYAECWSRAENVFGDPDYKYSLHLDVLYQDGRHMFRQVAAFPTGTHDWVRRSVTIFPAKPVAHLGVHGLLREHSGTAWFDDFRVLTPQSPPNMFDGFPVALELPPAPGNGVSMLDTGRGGSLKIDPATGALAGIERGGFFVRDVARRSDFIQPVSEVRLGPEGSVITGGTLDDLGLELTATWREIGDAVRIDGTLRDLTGEDRAITVYFAWPMNALGWTWHDDMCRKRVVAPREDYSYTVNLQCGANRSASRYPLACISGRDRAVAIGAPLDVPRLWRFGYDASFSELYAACDLGLTAATTKFPSEASFSLVLYDCDPEWGFRSALKRYYELFPNCFVKRNDHEGGWFAGLVDISQIPHAEDFGFGFHSGAHFPLTDKQQGVATFMYTSALNANLHLPPGTPHTLDAAKARLREWAASDGLLQRRVGHSYQASVIHDVNGGWVGGRVDAPWCKGYLFYANADPDLAEATSAEVTNGSRLLRAIDHAIKRYGGIQHRNWVNCDGKQKVWQDGYAIVPEQGRGGSHGLRLRRRPLEDTGSATRTVEVGQDQPAPITARVWVKTEDLTGEPDIQCGLRIAAHYTDGTPGWSFIMLSAPEGTNDWQMLEQTVTPQKPVRSLSVSLLIRQPHTGTVWFDDLSLTDGDRTLIDDGDFEPGENTFVAPLDGVYFDTFESRAAALNYRREHWAATDTPLTLDPEGRVCQLMIFQQVEFVREVAERIHPLGMLTFANGSPTKFAWQAAWLDVLGKEILWLDDEGHYVPDPTEDMCFRRAMSFQRPWVSLQNTTYEKFGTDLWEHYIKRLAAWGCFPGAFTHWPDWHKFWEHPEWYEPVRPLFRKYMPIIRRLSAAGWEPITHARAGSPAILVERFGAPGGELLFTVYNDSDQSQQATLALDREALGIATDVTQLAEVVSGSQAALDADGRISAPLAPGDLAVLALTPQ